MKKEETAAPEPRRSRRARVLFVCIGNACRSPMAEAIARSDAADVIEPSSAGLAPLGYIADLTKQTLIRNGYYTDGLASNVLTPQAGDAVDIVINMTGRPLEKMFRDAGKVEDWIVEDPFGADPETYQRIFESIQRRVNLLALAFREKRQNKTTTK